MLTIVCRTASPPMLAFLLLAGGAACGRSVPPDASRTPDTARHVAPRNAIQDIDSTAAPIIVTLRWDSLGIARSAPPARVDSAIARAIVELQTLARFEVLAVSRPVLAVSVRPRAPTTRDGLVASLRRHRLVADVQPSGIVRRP